MLSIVAPCFNEADGLKAFIQRTQAACTQRTCDYELILVDDGSTDTTWAEITHASQLCPEIQGVRLSKNHGHQAAVSAGLHYARGQYIAIIDADLQDPPEAIPEMLDLLQKEQADVVYGQRTSRSGVSLWKKASYWLFYRILAFLADCPIPLDTGDFRVISRRVCDLLKNMPEQQRFLRGMVAWVGFKQLPFFYRRASRHAGVSHYSLNQLIRLAADGIMAFSIKPLRLSLILAVGFGLVSALATAYIVVQALFFGHPPQGWTSLMAVLLIATSAQLLVLGLIGEYVGQAILQLKGRPLFIVAETTSSAPSDHK